MRHRLYAHIVWTTRERARLIDARVAQFLTPFLRAIARQERVLILEVGIVRTHVHLLVRYHPMANLSRVLQRLKGSSSAVADRECRSPGSSTLRWAKGYAIESVGMGSLAQARAYVRNQATRHPHEAIEGWDGATPLTASSEEEWVGPGREGLRAGLGAADLAKRRPGRDGR